MPSKGKTALPLPPAEIIKDYRIAYQSRQASFIARREVLSGKAKFGIFGDGKEVIQLAMARAFQKGDWRSGYYRDQTWMFALGALTIQQFFSQLYADADVNHDPSTAGRSMNAHFASRYLAPNGDWRDQTGMVNIAGDVSPTGTQMPRTVGLAYASVLYRQVPGLKNMEQFSKNGNEVAWATIGNASTAEGMFWETVNAIGVLHAPAIITVFDDDYGISVPNQFQMVKEDIYAILKGFQRDPCPAEKCDRGYDLYSVHAWDYPALLAAFSTAAQTARQYHVPALLHATELTQPYGHSTSGSQERYKSPERMKWEADYDCIPRFRQWILENDLASEKEFAAWEQEDTQTVEEMRKRAWEEYQAPLQQTKENALQRLYSLAQVSPASTEIHQAIERLDSAPSLYYRDIAASLHDSIVATRREDGQERDELLRFTASFNQEKQDSYSSFLYVENGRSLRQVQRVQPAYPASPELIPGFKIINEAFDAMLAREPRLIAFGEDLGKLGDVNQGFSGLQEKYGPSRVSDTGIREATILGQAIGLAMRGLRPIAEIQYLDYLLYALQVMADDLANLHWRTAGGQVAPVIVRARGHRLEGIWHSGSPMAGIINLVRGINVLVPRDMTRAAAFYNGLLQTDEPGIVVEVLNGYRLKEPRPENLSQICLPAGVPEVIREGKDVTVVTYGACCRIAAEAAAKLAAVGIEAEIIDVQSLLPFDLHGRIAESLKKTSRVLFLDEDVPGGASAYMLQQVLEKQGGYSWLDSPPRTLSGTDHRPAYGSDGDYWSKPNVETVFDAIYDLMHEVDPAAFPGDLAAKGGIMAVKVVAPRLGEGVTELTIVRWLKQESDQVQELEPLLEVETDKVVTEIPSPATGTLLKQVAAANSVTAVGSVIAWIGREGEPFPGSAVPGASSEPLPQPERSEAVPPSRPLPQNPETSQEGRSSFISPVVAKIAAENHINLDQVKGTGLGGRITKKDILDFLATATSQPPQGPLPALHAAASVQPSTGDRVVPLTVIRKSIAERMLQSKQTSPHVLTAMEADMSRVTAHMNANKDVFARDGLKLTYTAYFIASIVEGLRAYPLANSSWSDAGIIMHSACNIGMAVSLGEEGLIVPVIRDADRLSLSGLARAVNDLANRARAKKLQPEEVRGGTFTLTNHGISGSLFAMPIINQPQSGILGTGAIQKRPLVVTDTDGNDAIAIRPMVYLSFVFDHRILDGAMADWFLSKVVKSLEHWQ